MTEKCDAIHLKPLSKDLRIWSNLDHFCNVESRHSEGLGEAELAVGLRVGVAHGSQAHVLTLEGPHALAALDALPVEDDFGDDDGLFGVDLLLAENGKVKSND